MPNPNPQEGRCNAKLKHGRGYCANLPAIPPTSPLARKGGRCKFHGGLNTGPRTEAGKAKVSQNGLVHGLYAKMLMKGFKPEMQKVFAQVPRGTDMATEIALMRTKVAEYQAMLGRGELVMVTGKKKNPDGGEDDYRTQNVEDLLARAVTLLSKLTRDQHEMHPEAGKAGRLSVSINISGAAQRAAEQDLPDLEAGGNQPDDEPPLPAIRDDHGGADYDDPIAALDNE